MLIFVVLAKVSIKPFRNRKYRCGGAAVLLGTAKKTPLPKAVFKANRQNIRRWRSHFQREFVNLLVGKFLTKQNSRTKEGLCGVGTKPQGLIL